MTSSNNADKSDGQTGSSSSSALASAARSSLPSSSTPAPALVPVVPLQKTGYCSLRTPEHPSWLDKYVVLEGTQLKWFTSKRVKTHTTHTQHITTQDALKREYIQYSMAKKTTKDNKADNTCTENLFLVAPLCLVSSFVASVGVFRFLTFLCCPFFLFLCCCAGFFS